MSLDANIFLFIQPTGTTYINKLTNRINTSVSYFSDTNGESVNCKQEELFNMIKLAYQFDRKTIDDLSGAVNLGVSVVVNLLEKTFFEIEQEALVYEGAVRSNIKAGANSLDILKPLLDKGQAAIKRRYVT